MFAKAAVYVLFAQALLLIQSALSQACGRSAFAAAPGFGSTYGLASPGLTSPFRYNGLASGLSRNGLACNGLAGYSLAYDSINDPVVEITPTTGGGLPVTSASPIAPNSVVVASENMYEGTLAVEGELPFVGTVAMEGVVPSAGAGVVNHACGNGATRMVSQDGATVASGFGTGLAPASLAPGNLYGGIGAPFSYGSGLAGLANAGLGGSYPALALGAALSPVSARGGALGLGAYGGAIGSAYGGALAPAAAYGGAIAPGAAYGGAGEGNVAVIGELPVAGNSAVAGQVPIMGAVRFGGDLPAAGAVTISGKCDCGCCKSYGY